MNKVFRDSLDYMEEQNVEIRLDFFFYLKYRKQLQSLSHP